MLKAGSPSEGILSARTLSAGTLPAGILALVFCLGCGRDDVKYTPRAAPSGVQANLPPVPNLPQKPVKSGEAYTVWGAAYHLRSRVHHASVAGKNLKVTGFITKTNMADAPECAVHKTGQEDPEDCNPPVPAFWLGDTKDAPENESIKVMGWASNYAQIHDAILEYDKLKADEKPDEPPMDGFWGVPIPYPLPAAGAKVTVTGQYSTTFTRATSGAEADPIMGLLTYEEIETHEPAPEPANLPGMKPRKRR